MVWSKKFPIWNNSSGITRQLVFSLIFAFLNWFDIHKISCCIFIQFVPVCQKWSTSFEHKMAIQSAPNFNKKITSALLHIQFDETLLSFDLKKAVLQFELKNLDSNRLLFLWFRGIENNNFNINGCRNLRLSFGLQASPCILMLYKNTHSQSKFHV